MTALVSAELLRLRTVRSPRYIGLAMVVFAGVLAAVNVLDPAFASESSPSARAESLQAIGLNGVLLAAVFSAGIAATEFKRGSIALTYMAHPNRRKVAAARTLTHAMAGGLLAALAAAVALAAGLIAGSGSPVDLNAADVAGTVAGALFSGAVIGGLGVLVGTLVRNPTVASTAVIAPTIVGGALQISALYDYLPFGLAGRLLGIDGSVPVPLAALLLLAYPALVALVVHLWGIDRDIT
jgi:ABC-type transport system involved in multi-copper enzyme maturation permease subunit